MSQQINIDFAHLSETFCYRLPSDKLWWINSIYLDKTTKQSQLFNLANKINDKHEELLLKLLRIILMPHALYLIYESNEENCYYTGKGARTFILQYLLLIYNFISVGYFLGLKKNIWKSINWVVNCHSIFNSIFKWHMPRFITIMFEST